MYKFSTMRGELYIHCCLVTCAQNRGRGGGPYSKGSLILSFGPYEGRFFDEGLFGWGEGGTNSRI